MENDFSPPERLFVSFCLAFTLTASASVWIRMSRVHFSCWNLSLPVKPRLVKWCENIWRARAAMCSLKSVQRDTRASYAAESA